MQKKASVSSTIKDQALENPISINASENTDFPPQTQQPPIQEEDPTSLLTIRKRKYGSRWKQQALHAYRQHFNLLHVFFLYVTLGIIFMSLGGLCYYYASNYPVAISLDYTDCKEKSDSSDLTCDSKINSSKSINCTCQVAFKIDDDNIPDDGEGRNLVLFFELSNYYQNIRHYKKDVDWAQLGGKAIASDGRAITPAECALKILNSMPIFPCGQLANSYFSDTFKLFDKMGGEVKLNFKNIAWEADKTRFKNPTKEQLKGKKITDLLTLPEDWHDDLKREFVDDKGIENEHFIVWMRSAALETFRNKYAYIHLTKEQAGSYTIDVEYRYEVKSFQGSKKIVIAADSKDRPTDYFFFYSYIIVGGLCLLIGPAFCIANCMMNAFHKSSSSSKPSQVPSNTNQLNPEPDGDDLQPISENDMEDPPTRNTTGRPSLVSVSTKSSKKKLRAK